MSCIRAVRIALVAAILSLPAVALAEPPQIADDEGYSRLAQWESHLDQRIEAGIEGRWLGAERGWRIQKELDNVEIRLVQAYYDSDHGIDTRTFRQFAGQLRRIGNELSDYGWSEPEYEDDDSYDSRGVGADNVLPPQGYYRQGNYESDCRRGNAVAGTIFGALGGGLIGGVVSHGSGAAVAGGVIVGGLLGNALSQDIDCDDHEVAFSTYQQAFGGDLNREYQWRHGAHYGTIVTSREYYRDGYVCRDFHTVNYRDGQRLKRDGSACR